MTSARTNALVVGVAAIVGGALGALIIAPNSDALTSLAWGNVMSHGVRPDFDASLTPVPHPLAIFAASPLGFLPPDAALVIWGGVGGMALFGLGWAVFALARAYAGAGAPGVIAGVLAVLVLITRPRILYYAATGSQDVMFAALALGAIALIAAAPRRDPRLPLALIAGAGLLRPEAWVLGVAYVALLALTATSRRHLRVPAALAIAPIAIWFGFDLFATGNPIASIEHARTGGGHVSATGFIGTDTYQLDFATRWLPDRADLSATLLNLPAYLGLPLLVAGLAGLAVGLRAGIGAIRERTAAGPATHGELPPQAVATAGALVLIATFAAEKLAGFAVIDRYTVPLAAVVIAIGAGALGRIRSGIPVIVAVIAGLIILTGIENTDQLKRDYKVFPFVNKLRDSQHDVADLARLDEVKRAIGHCPRIIAAGRDRRRILEARAVLALNTDRDLTRVEIRRRARTKKRVSSFRSKILGGSDQRFIRGRWEFRSKCLKAQ